GKSARISGLLLTTKFSYAMTQTPILPGLLTNPMQSVWQNQAGAVNAASGAGRGRPAGSGTAQGAGTPAQTGVATTPGTVAAQAGPAPRKSKGFGNTPTAASSSGAKSANAYCAPGSAMSQPSMPTTGPMSMAMPASVGMSMPKMMGPGAFGSMMGKM